MSLGPGSHGVKCADTGPMQRMFWLGLGEFYCKYQACFEVEVLIRAKKKTRVGWLDIEEPIDGEELILQDLVKSPLELVEKIVNND